MTSLCGGIHVISTNKKKDNVHPLSKWVNKIAFVTHCLSIIVILYVVGYLVNGPRALMPPCAQQPLHTIKTTNDLVNFFFFNLLFAILWNRNVIRNRNVIMRVLETKFDFVSLE
ncbi:hypothetical protein RHMOL_Rhmol04G0089900 [Rhododendron molle]|uniref:Uncharacterized protein n=1 Tax=Rhododendron molle TaxID=49168 RepID=A0ACC0P082_RHOML|nr:hypothetical protein RHMOL_Rhmol04G0089900 [Rhododendron molle]